MENKNVEYVTIKSRRGNEYFYFLRSKLLLLKESFENSSDRRKEMIWEKLLLCEEKIEKKYITAKEVESHVFREGLQELIIEVTTSCNLRCSYCIFGENYNELRSHGFKNMSFESVKKSIDMYLSLIEKGRNYNPNRRPCISFYGGEPLINFETIKKAVLYIKEIFTGEIFLTFTSNGLLLNEERLTFFKDQGVVPMFSLDGPKKEHDRNRVGANGEGTFDKAIKNIELAAKIYNKPMFVNAVYDVNTDLKKVLEYFSQNQNIVCVSISGVSDVNTNYYDKFSEKQKSKFNNMVKDLFDKQIQLITEGNTREHGFLKYLDLLFSRSCSSILSRNLFEKISNKFVPYTSTCTPGDKIFVDVNGNLFPCERISRGKHIGYLDGGLDFQMIADYINSFLDRTHSKCTSCSFSNNCPTCFLHFLCETSFRVDSDACETYKNDVIENLQRYVDINEANPEWMELFRNEYYKQIGEFEVIFK